MRRWGFLVFLIWMAALDGWGQSILWDTAYGPQVAGGYGPTRVTGLAAFPDRIIALSQGIDYDSALGFPTNLVWLSAFDYQGRLLWHRRLPDLGVVNQVLIAKITDSTFALATSYLNPLYAPTPQHFGLRLRLLDLEARERWHWSINEGIVYNASPQALKAMSGGRIAFGCNRTDTTGTVRLERELRVFTAGGLVERVLRVTDQPHRIFNNTLSPLPGGRWRTLSYDQADRRFAVILDSNWNVVRRDTMARRWQRGESSETLAATSDGGYLFLTTASFQDTMWTYMERHDGQNRTLWTRQLPNAGYGAVTALADGGYLWGIGYAGDLGNSRDNHSFFERRDAEGDTVWSVELPSFAATGSFDSYGFTCSVLDGTGGGVGGGIKETSATGRQAFIAYVNNLGIPFNPLTDSVRVATRPRQTQPSSQLLAYPNPTTSSLTILAQPRQPAILYTMQGKLVSETMLDAQGKGRIDLSALPKGMYVLRQGVQRIKVMKE